MAKELVCPTCCKATFDQKYVWDGVKRLKCAECGEWAGVSEWKTVKQLRAERDQLSERLRAAEVQLATERERGRAELGEMAAKSIRHSRTMVNFGHIPAVVRALEWVAEDLRALPTKEEK